MGIHLECIDEKGTEHTFVYDADVREIQLNDLRLEYVDLEPLAGCSELEQLDLSRNTIWEIDLTPLSKCHCLRTIGLGMNSLVEIRLEPLSMCDKLEEIDLSFNRIDEICLTPLCSLSRLKSLDLSYNRFANIDISPLVSCTALEEINLSYNYLRQIDLSPLASSSMLKKVYLHQKSLKAIDLRPLRFCEHLEDVTVFESISHSMESPFLVFRDKETDHIVSPATRMIDFSFLVLNPSFIGVLVKLVKRRFGVSDLVVSLFSQATLESIELDKMGSHECETLYGAMQIFHRMRTDIPFPISDLKLIRRLSPIVRKKEPMWKQHHLVQCAISAFGLGWIGLVDSDPGNILDLVEVGCSINEFHDFVIDRVLGQIDSNRTTIGMDLNRIQEHSELSRRIPKILALRRSEIELYSHIIPSELKLLSQEGRYIDLQPLWNTAYGFRILRAMDLGLRCTTTELVAVSVVLEQLGFVPRKSCVIDSQFYELFRTRISKPLQSYIVNAIIANHYYL